jgi:hypothetical protein
MIVYHYTDIDNLDSILFSTSKSHQRLNLWAKHHSFLTDDPQRIFGRYLLPSCIESIEEELEVESQFAITPLLKDIGYLNFINESALHYDDHSLDLAKYVISFSEDQDNLDLWLRNGNSGKGIAIGFDTNKLCLDSERLFNVFANNCTYWSDEIKSTGYKLNTQSQLYKNIKETYQKLSEPKILDALKVIHTQDGPSTAILQRIKNTLITNLIATYDVFHKQDIWQSEREYRLSLNSLPIDVEYHKDEEGGYIPFANVSIPVTALRMIIIGPKCGKNAFGMIKSLLQRKGISHEVFILNSNFPLR